MHALLLLGLVLDVFVPATALLDGRTPLLAQHATNGAAAGTKGAVAGGAREAAPVGLEAAYAPNGRRWLLSGALVYAMAGCFAFFAPLVYGAPLSAEELNSRMWLDSWR